MKKYEYEIAISLCKEDIEFARKLTQSLNPGLKVFFYEDKQEELISKSGPEEFAKVFKERARIVVILYREAWGSSFNTELERGAIIDRIKNGYNFICVIPLEKGKSPAWYPETHIYLSPFNFSIERLAQFIEFKVVEQGGIVKPVTFEEHLENFQERIKNRTKKKEFLSSQDSVAPCKEELKKFANLFNENIETTRKRSLPVRVSQRRLHGVSDQGELGIGNYILRVAIILNTYPKGRIFSSQCYTIYFLIFNRLITESQPEPRKLIERYYRFNSDNEFHRGWSEVEILKETQFTEYLFHDIFLNYYYDLKKIRTTEELLEEWLIELYKYTEIEFNEVIP